MKYLFLLWLLLGLATSAFSASTPSSCEQVLNASPSELETARQGLQRDLADIPSALKKLHLSAEGILPLNLLGAGASGSVVKVRWKDRYYALKTFHSDSNGATTTGILIQNTLGKLGMAPKVIGILDSKAYTRWLKLNSDRIRKEIGDLNLAQSALLMELTEHRNLKYLPLHHGYIPRVSPEGYQRILDQSVAYDKALSVLGIEPQDVDAVITEQGNLKLIDISWYFMKPGVAEGRLLRSLKDYLDKIEILTP